MVDSLRTDPSGLSSAAADSSAIAEDLVSHAAIDSSIDTSQPSYAGLAAFADSVIAVRDRQAARIKSHAERMFTAAHQYDAADAESANRLKQSV